MNIIKKKVLILSLSICIINIVFFTSIYSSTNSSPIHETRYFSATEILPVANYFAHQLLHTVQYSIELTDTLCTKENQPYAFVFVCEKYDDNKPTRFLELTVSSSTDHFPLRSFYFYTSKADDMYNANQPDEYYLPKNNIHKQSTNTERPGLNRIKAHHTWENIIEKIQINSTSKDSTEVIISGVPNYLWYLNCGITASLMIYGYWNDNGYDNFIPGGNSQDGYYWGLAEEFTFIGESPDTWIQDHPSSLSYYTQASEYGNSCNFDYTKFQESDI